MDIASKIGRGVRVMSGALARMSWKRVGGLWLLLMIFSGSLPDWPIVDTLKELLPALAFFCLILKVESGARTRAEGREIVAKADALRAHGVADAWSAKLDSHFLFNAMATIEHLIASDPALAVKAQSALAMYLRSGLADSDKSSVTAQARACESYLFIQKIRLSERLEWSASFSGDGAMPGRVAVGLLELAVADGVEPAVNGGKIALSCFREGDRLSWRMECPEAGVAQAEAAWRARWLSEAKAGTWSVSVDHGRARLELGWES